MNVYILLRGWPQLGFPRCCTIVGGAGVVLAAVVALAVLRAIQLDVIDCHV